MRSFDSALRGENMCCLWFREVVVRRRGSSLLVIMKVKTFCTCDGIWREGGKESE
jgi:hypothetical protein